MTGVMRELAATAFGQADAGPILVISHGGVIRTFIHATVGVMPPPLENGALFRLRFEGSAFVSAEQE
jgi:broad specificity phosphatase PhoE